MLSVYVRSPPSVLAHSACARRTTTTMGSRLSILPLSAWSKGMSLIPWLGKPEVLWRAIRLGNVHHDLRLGADLVWCADDSSTWSGDLFSRCVSWCVCWCFASFFMLSLGSHS